MRRKREGEPLPSLPPAGPTRPWSTVAETLSTAELALPSIGWAVVWRPKLARPRKGGEVITLRVSPFPWMPPPSPPSMSSEQLSGGGDEEKRLEAPLVEMVGDKGSSCESRG